MILVTLGDPLSINTRILVDSLRHLRKEGVVLKPVVLIGDYGSWKWQLEFFDLVLSLDIDLIQPETFLERDWKSSVLNPQQSAIFVDIGGGIRDPRLSTEKARAQVALDALNFLGQVPDHWNYSVLTCPVSKSALHSIGFDFAGQTEFFENLWEGQGIMLLMGPRLAVGLTTNHLPLSEVTAVLTQSLVRKKIEFLHRTLIRLGRSQSPKIAVAGINPHCGDQGAFGTEDDTVIRPAVAWASTSFNVEGPVPADTVFYRCLQGEFDAVLAQYHDQGLGPLKTVHFDTAVNITGGLKRLRVSPDHGPAADRFTASDVSSRSMYQALKVLLAAE